MPQIPGDERGNLNSVERIKRAWWNWISAGPNDQVPILTVLGVCVGVLWMLAAFVAVGIPPTDSRNSEFIDLGKSYFKPDRDMAIYIIGSCAAAMLGIGMHKIRSRHSKKTTDAGARPPANRVSILLALAVMVTCALDLILDSAAVPAKGLSPSASFFLAVAGMSTAGTFLLLAIWRRHSDRSIRHTPNVPASAGDRHAADMANTASARPKRSVTRGMFDLGMVALIISLVYTSDWQKITYQSYSLDQFHHWDFFFMGPALSFAHGRALGTEVFSQYGVGWPVVVSSISAVTPIDYSTCAGMIVICGTVYFVLYYFTLRHVAGDSMTAAAAFVVLLNLQLFHGMHGDVTATLWTWPSSSVLRSLFDLGFFAMVALHGRWGQPLWLIASAAVVGVGLIFELDTGLYLLATLGYYLFVAWLHTMNGLGSPWEPIAGMRSVAGVAGAVVLVTTAGLFVGSRGTMFSAEFYEKWLEAVRVFRDGVSSLPIAENGLQTLAMFVIMVSLSICYLLLPVLRRRPGRPGFLDRYLGCWGAYSWCSLVLFVNRSHEFNLFHCILPSGVLATHLARTILDRSTSIAARRRGFAPAVTSLVRWGVSGLILVVALEALWGNRTFRDYPNLWNRPARHAGVHNDLCLMRGVCGLPARAAESVAEFRAVTEAMAGYRASGKSVEIIHPFDPIFYLASGCPPMDRYSPLLPNLLTKDQLARAIDRFRSRATSRVVIQDHVDRRFAWRDAWSAFRNAVLPAYAMEKRIGSFEIWRLKSAR
jgi:hypothetical protein